MTDPDILSAMIARTEAAYHLPAGTICGRSRSAIACAARFELVSEAVAAGYTRTFVGAFLGGRDVHTINNAIARHGERTATPVFKSVRAR